MPQEEKNNPGVRRTVLGILGREPSSQIPGPGSLPSSVGANPGGRKLCKIGFPHLKAHNPPDSNNLISKSACELAIGDKSHHEVAKSLAQSRLQTAISFHRDTESWKS